MKAAKTWLGFDYSAGKPVELERGEWKTRIERAHSTKRVGGDLLIYKQAGERVVLDAEVYDK